MLKTTNRREFLRTSGIAAVSVPYLLSSAAAIGQTTSNDRPQVGCIGNGGMGRGDLRNAKRYGDIVAVCDVDREHAERAAKDPQLADGKATIYSDYRQLLDRNDIEVVTISTPDHWHTKIAIDAMRAGKDIYCQKPLTLTIEEGQQICQVAKETGRVFQVGTQQRSENANRFLIAVALAHSGRLGKIRRVIATIGGAPRGTKFKKSDPPEQLDWENWLGQAPLVDYIPERCHGQFRWWYEYSGGKLTDWGAHHVDIAQWAIEQTDSGPSLVEPLLVDHPVRFAQGWPQEDDTFNTATHFLVRCVFPGDVELLIRSQGRNGVLIEGEKGRIFVSRGSLDGKPVEELKDNPLPANALTDLRKGKKLDSHMGNFMECVKDRSVPVSDVFSHHRILTTCHLANISLRLNRELRWEPQSEQIVGDEEARAFQRREQRQGYEIVV